MIAIIDKIREKKIRNKDDSYISVLEISDKDFFELYDSIDTEIAEEIVADYLIEREDDGRPDNIEVKYDKANNVVTIRYNLHYVGNDHTHY